MLHLKPLSVPLIGHARCCNALRGRLAPDRLEAFAEFSKGLELEPQARATVNARADLIFSPETLSANTSNVMALVMA